MKGRGNRGATGGEEEGKYREVCGVGGVGILLPLLVASSNKAVSTACPGKCT